MASTYEAYLFAQINYLANNTQVLLSTTTLGVNTASVTLSVPSGTTYNYLTVNWRARSSAAVAGEQMFLQMNGDSGSNYSWQTNEANATNAVSGTHAGALTTHIQIATITGANATSALWFATGSFDVGGASDATNYKTAQGTGVANITVTNAYAGVYGGQWNSAAAVTSLTLTAATGNLVTGSIFSLYGGL
jgi:hypothetical protein